MTDLFVYGTLKRGQPNHDWLADGEYLGPAETLPFYRLVNCGESVPKPCNASISWKGHRRSLRSEKWNWRIRSGRYLPTSTGPTRWAYRTADAPGRRKRPIRKRSRGTYFGDPA